MKITIIAAMDAKRGIGKDGKIHWYISEELEHFKEETYGHPVIMGRKTFENIEEKLDGPLPGRLNIVLSSSKQTFHENTVIARNKQTALEAAMDSYSDEVYIAGGRSVYDQFIDEADRAVISHIPDDYNCDTFFPVDPLVKWKVTSVENDYEGFEVAEYEPR